MPAAPRAPSPDIARLFPFPLDDFQVEAMESIAAGENVVVCAPTGSGKTAIAEYALHRAHQRQLRCFYTTPLKALSNQKFHDLQQLFGEDQVGLLTGDISVRRDAQIVVMTTEVFRNMLYGTILGDVHANLQGVVSVILDECHYMNDVERGTVWEESIIYCPREIQLVALSATVANAPDLVDWISATHAPTRLIQSDYRPVPLKFYYYFKSLKPLLSESGSLNPALRQISPPPKRDGFRKPKKEDRPEKVSPENVVRALAEREMLPAIYFVFSRRGCELALRASQGAVTLTLAEADAIKASLKDFLRDNPFLIDHPHLPYLRQGLAAHHAGLLPPWKSLVERLFQQGLIKCVFATETLAAGINMPARTTVISAISKYSDEGHRPMTASEFLQMSGRAGRRGMDTVGHVVVVHHPMERVEEAAKLARAEADPLLSRFTPSYGMVLNLLQHHSLEECRQLVERSFGQFLAERVKGSLGSRSQSLAKRVEELSRPLCPERPGDLPAYHKLKDKERSLHRQIEAMSRGMRPGNRGRKEAIAQLRDQKQDVRGMMERTPCHECPVRRPCGHNHAMLAELTREKGDLGKLARRVETPYWKQFTRLKDLLEALGYMQDDRPTELGLLAAYLRGTNVVLLTEVARSGILERLNAAQLAAVMTALLTEDTRQVPGIRLAPSTPARRAVGEVQKVAEAVLRWQKRFEVEVPAMVNPVFSGLAEAWAEGASWEEVRDRAGMDEGDVVRALRRTLDMARQWSRAPGLPPVLGERCREVDERIGRDQVKASLLVIE